jgi:hypothetical protein
LDAPPLGAMARLRSPSLFHTVTEHPAMLFVAMFVAASDVAGFMFSGRVFGSLPETSGRRSCKAPGCLKSESEERETWTAESLRAAFSNGEGLGFFRERCGHGRDFGGLTFQGFLHRPIAQAIGRVGTSSNVVISRDQFSPT